MRICMCMHVVCTGSDELRFAVDCNALNTLDIYSTLYQKQAWRGYIKKNSTGFSTSTSVFPCQYHSSNGTYASSTTCCSFQTDERAKDENFQKTNALMEIGQRWIEK